MRQPTEDLIQPKLVGHNFQAFANLVLNKLAKLRSLVPIKEPLLGYIFMTRRVMGSACASCWTGEQPPRCWVAGSGCRRSTLLRRWALAYSALSDVHKCRQCWPFFTPWYACRIVIFDITFDTYDIYLYIWNVWNGNGNEVDGVQEGNTECAAALLAVGANVRAVNARGQVVVSLFADCQWINFVQYALHLAALAQSPETLELLLAKGWL